MSGRLWSSIFIGIRIVLVVRLLFLIGGPLAVIFALAEILVIGSTILAMRVGQVDDTGAGRWVPVFYLAPLLLTPATGGPMFAAAWVVMLALFFVQVLIRSNMGRRCTIGVPVFVSLLEHGPYRFIRHPLALVECVQVLVIVISAATAWNITAGVVALAAYVLNVLIEERHLTRWSAYVAYAASVRWRLVPGVW